MIYQEKLRKRKKTVMKEDCCVLVSSSDNTFDVFNLVSVSVVKTWPLKHLDFFVGLNCKKSEEPFRTIPAPVSNWRNELAYQVNALPQCFNYVILILDDFWFYEKFDSNKLIYLTSIVREKNIDYLRLKPVERSLIGKLLLRTKLKRGEFIVKLNEDEPYYSSLQVAVWKRSYLSRMLQENGSIWDFEHLVVSGSRHFAIVQSFLNYSHLVEKGKWFKHAPATIGFTNKTAFEKRGFHRSLIKHSVVYNYVKRLFFGYSLFKLRRRIASK